MARIETFFCPDCNQSITADRIDHKRKCKGEIATKQIDRPEKAAITPEPSPSNIPLPEPEKPSEPSEIDLSGVNITSAGIEPAEKVKERVTNWRKNNKEKYNAYMRALMKEKRKKAREERQK